MANDEVREKQLVNISRRREWLRNHETLVVVLLSVATTIVMQLLLSLLQLIGE